MLKAVLVIVAMLNGSSAFAADLPTRKPAPVKLASGQARERGQQTGPTDQKNGFWNKSFKTLDVEPVSKREIFFMTGHPPRLLGCLPTSPLTPMPGVHR